MFLQVPRASILTHKEKLERSEIINDIAKTWIFRTADGPCRPNVTEDQQNKVASAIEGTHEQVTKITRKVKMFDNLRATMNKEFKKCLTEVKSLATDCIELKNRNDKSEVEIKNMERQLMLKDVTLAEQDLRIQVCTELYSLYK